MQAKYTFIFFTIIIFFFSGQAMADDGGGPIVFLHGNGQGGPPPPPCKNPQCCDNGAPSWDVNMVNMNLYVHDTPLWYPTTTGPSVRIKLNYNTQSTVTGQEAFGNKWSFRFSSSLETAENGDITLLLGNGRKYTYTATETGYGQPYRYLPSLVKIGDNHFEIRYSSGKVKVYNHYVASLQKTFLTEIRHIDNQTISLSYDGQDRLHTITDAQNHVTTLLYNADNLVYRIEGPFNRSAGFEYDAERNLMQITDMGGYATQLEYDDASLLTALINDAGRTEFYIEPGTSNGLRIVYPPPGTPMSWNYRITVTMPDGGKEEYYYSALTGTSWHVAAENYVEYQDARRNNYTDAAKTQYTFASPIHNNVSLAREEISSITYPDGRKKTFAIDRDTGWVKSESDTASNTEAYTYNDKGSKLTLTAPNGEVTTYEYEANGIDRKKVITSLGTTEYTHDSAHQVTSVKDPLNHTTSYEYNTQGQVSKITDPLGIETIYTYNGNHRLIEVKRAGQVLSTMTYDAVGRLKTSTGATGLTSTYDYDNFDHIIKITYSDGKITTMEYGSGAGPHLVTKTTDRAGRVSTSEYNAGKQLIRTVNPGGGVSKYEYDSNGNMVKFIDPNGNATSFAYNAGNQLIQKTYADGKSIAFTYYSTGQLQSRTNSRGVVTYYYYDEMYNLVSKTYTDDTPEVIIAYDNYGRPTAITDGTGTYSMDYNELSQLLSIDGPLDNDTITYTYDADGRTTGFSVENGRSVVYTIDDINRLSKISVGGADFTYAYPEANSPLLQSLSMPNGVVTAFDYNGINQLTSQTNSNSAAAVINKYVYTYNDHDLRASEEVTNAPLPTDFTEGMQTFDYNQLNQLLSATNPEQLFTYDDDGNMHTGYTPEGYQFTAEYDAENRVKSIEYTDNANVVHKRVYTYRWDSFIGRIRKYENNTLVSDITIVRDRALALQDRETATNSVLREYVWGKSMGGGIGGLLSMRQNGEDFYYLYDGKGNVTSVVDSNQLVVASYQYNAFGRLMNVTGTLEQPFQFSTKRYDAGTGLNYYGYRFYAPAIERWLNRDPIGEAGGINLYGFVQNDPVNWVDPWGLDYNGSVYDGLRSGRDWLLNPNHWWNDPNHWTSKQTDLGEMSCMATCMGQPLLGIHANDQMENAGFWVAKNVFPAWARGTISVIETGYSWIDGSQNLEGLLFNDLPRCMCECGIDGK